VKKHPELWIPPNKQAMTFFQLFKGWLIFPKEIFSEEDMDESLANASLKPDWMTFVYATFPSDKLSMRIIEGYIDSRPILKWLSGEQLPVTDRPLFYTKSVSTISGQIVGERQLNLHTTSWLSTDDILFLWAFLLCNQDANRWFHVLGPAIMDKVHAAYKIMEKAMKQL
jgi:hypothetical protein